MNFNNFKLPPTTTQHTKTPRASKPSSAQWHIADTPPRRGGGKKRSFPSSLEDSSPSARMSAFRFVLPETASPSPKTSQRTLQEDIQDDSMHGVGNPEFNELNVNNNEDDDIFVEDDDDLDFDGNEIVSVASNWQPTTPTTTSPKPPPHHSTVPPIAIPVIAKPLPSGAKSIPTSFTTPMIDPPVTTASSYPSTPGFLSSPRFIVSPAQVQSPNTVTVSPSQWARSIKLPPPAMTSAGDRGREGAGASDRGEYRAGGGSGKGAAYVKGGYAERLVSLIGKESSDHTIWAHGLSRQANLPSTTRPRVPISLPTLYKVSSKQVAHGTIYTCCEAVAGNDEGADRSCVVVFSPVYSTYDEAEADKIEVGKVLRVWRPWIEINNPDKDGTGGGTMMIVTRFRVLEGEEAGEYA